METNISEGQQLGWIQRDASREIIIGENGCVTCISEGTEFEIPFNNIDLNCDTLQVTIDNKIIIVKLHEYIQDNNNTLTQNEVSGLQQRSTTEEPFLWTDATTRLFLDLYKDAIINQRTRTKKMLWRKRSETLQAHDYNISAAQVENKFKSLERGYKNMITNNKRTGRNRISCSYEKELSELFAKKHNIILLAVSGSEGTIVREDAGPLSSQETTTINLSTGTSVNTDNICNNKTNNSIDDPLVIETENNPSCNLRRDSTQYHSTITSQVKNSSRKQLGNTGKMLEICQQEMRTLIQDIRREINERFEIQKQMLQTYTDYTQKMYEAMQERNEILKEIVKQNKER